MCGKLIALFALLALLAVSISSTVNVIESQSEAALYNPIETDKYKQQPIGALPDQEVHIAKRKLCNAHNLSWEKHFVLEFFERTRTSKMFGKAFILFALFAVNIVRISANPLQKRCLFDFCEEEEQNKPVVKRCDIDFCEEEEHIKEVIKPIAKRCHFEFCEEEEQIKEEIKPIAKHCRFDFCEDVEQIKEEMKPVAKRCPMDFCEE
ncbi:hypothetical protein QR680_000164 [Steinernema hermaphroditum]|uniref:Uncharacterized protein n=1 Tax=Steinernema hermaphroditum TaxID=289476 RepID=A0AA39LDP3_9BILA|nr:hypothetical protein QR680_000164 [Steinernema hermaphroditum]